MITSRTIENKKCQKASSSHSSDQSCKKLHKLLRGNIHDASREFYWPLLSAYIYSIAMKRCTFMVNAGLEVNFSVHLQSLASKIFSTSKLVRPQANPFHWDVWETRKILTRKRLLVVIFLTRSSEFGSVNFEPWLMQNKTNNAQEATCAWVRHTPIPFQNHSSMCIADKMNRYMQNNTYDTIWSCNSTVAHLL